MALLFRHIYRSFLLIPVLLAAITQLAFSQFLSDKERFSVNYVAGCVPLEITITNLWPDKDINVNYHPDGRTNPSITPNGNTITYTYTEAGTYELEQILALPDDQISNNEDKWDKITISVYEPLAPSAQIFRCTNHTVQVRINTETDNYDQYQIDYGDGNVDLTDGTNIPSHQYASGGTYTISIDGLYAGGKRNCDTYTETVETIQALTAGQINMAEVTAIDNINGQVTLGFSLDPDTEYSLEVSRGGYNNFSTLRLLPLGTAETVIDGLNTRDNFYCFRVVASTGCSDADVPSNIVCSNNLQAEPRNNENVISWDTDALDFQSYQLYRNGDLLATYNDSGRSFYTDTDVECNREYCYQLITQNVVSVSQSFSTCVTAVSNRTPEGTEELEVSYTGDSLRIRFAPPESETDGNFVIYRSQNQGAFLPLDTVSGTTYYDTRFSNASANDYCYVVRFADNCGNLSEPSLAGCPIRLSLERTAEEVFLDWGVYEGFKMVDYHIIELLDEAGNVVDTDTVGNVQQTTVEVDLEERMYYAYRIGAVSGSLQDNGNGPPYVAYSNVVTFTLESEFFFPNAFTPDGDGLNDYFYPLGPYVASVNLYVYNRWGELVYAGENTEEGWDGYFNGQEAPEGKYTCVAEITDTGGRVISKRATFMLIRSR